MSDELKTYLESVKGVLAEKANLYYNQILVDPIPDDWDRAIMDLVERFKQASEEDRTEYLKALRGNLNLVSFGVRMAITAVREGTVDYLRSGILGNLMEDFTDFRDNFVGLGPLYHSAIKLGEDPDSLFRESSQLVSPEARTHLEGFLVNNSRNQLWSWGWREEGEGETYRYHHLDWDELTPPKSEARLRDFDRSPPPYLAAMDPVFRTRADYLGLGRTLRLAPDVGCVIIMVLGAVPLAWLWLLFAAPPGETGAPPSGFSIIIWVMLIALGVALLRALILNQGREAVLYPTGIAIRAASQFRCFIPFSQIRSVSPLSLDRAKSELFNLSNHRLTWALENNLKFETTQGRGLILSVHEPEPFLKHMAESHSFRFEGGKWMNLDVKKS